MTIGIDILELKRVKQARHLSRLAELVLTTGERIEFATHPDPVTFFASRFALKEAVIKAWPDKLTYHDIEISKDGLKPVVRIANMNGRSVAVSLSHSTDYVAGFAVMN